MCHGTCIGQRIVCGIGSPLLPCWSLGLNSGPQTGQQALLPTGLFCWPQLLFLNSWFTSIVFICRILIILIIITKDYRVISSIRKGKMILGVAIVNAF